MFAYGGYVHWSSVTLLRRRRTCSTRLSPAEALESGARRARRVYIARVSRYHGGNPRRRASSETLMTADRRTDGVNNHSPMEILSGYTAGTRSRRTVKAVVVIILAVDVDDPLTLTAPVTLAYAASPGATDAPAPSGSGNVARPRRRDEGGPPVS